MKLAIFSFFLLIFINQNLAQNIRDTFIVEVIERNSMSEERICYGTIVTSRHVMTAATCVSSVSTSAAQRIFIRSENVLHGINRISIHPSYRSGQPWTPNIALIDVSWFKGRAVDNKVLPFYVKQSNN
jgi:hypothetical protein